MCTLITSSLTTYILCHNKVPDPRVPHQLGPDPRVLSRQLGPDPHQLGHLREDLRAVPPRAVLPERVVPENAVPGQRAVPEKAVPGGRVQEQRAIIHIEVEQMEKNNTEGKLSSWWLED